MAAKIKQAGFKGMKIRAWRRDRPTTPMPAADSGRCWADFEIMFDRTAHLPGKVWDLYRSNSGSCLEKHRAYWLEAFDRNDFLSPARLAREVNISITGGEAYQGLDPFRGASFTRAMTFFSRTR